MKTTLDVPEALLNDAMQISGAKTKRAAVLTALEELIRRGRMQALARKLGDSDTFSAVIERLIPPKGTMAAALEAAGSLPDLPSKEFASLENAVNATRRKLRPSWS
jgi:hypothetical protein